MKITVSRDGAVIGVWERADIRAAVADGKLKSDDRYFAQGMSTWLPLSTLTTSFGSRGAKNNSSSNPSTSRSAVWQRAMMTAGYLLVFTGVFTAITSPNYVTQALIAAAGFVLIAAARTLP